MTLVMVLILVTALVPLLLLAFAPARPARRNPMPRSRPTFRRAALRVPHQRAHRRHSRY
ncbi:hypothetical protein ACFYZ9_19120 [Streptomyces sp. NPDC001691]|uniref:hypothetical protein n=1 Tax=unclassified Streptomyces TaxID=2593676 RepID=UPI001675B026|nr:hypothetical protein [Streptomyces sp. SDr-06]